MKKTHVQRPMHLNEPWEFDILLFGKYWLTFYWRCRFVVCVHDEDRADQPPQRDGERSKTAKK